MITISCFVVCYYSYTNSEINSATALAKFAIITDVNEVCIISEVHIVSVSLFLGGGGLNGKENSLDVISIRCHLKFNFLPVCPPQIKPGE